MDNCRFIISMDTFVLLARFVFVADLSPDEETELEWEFSHLISLLEKRNASAADKIRADLKSRGVMENI